MRTRARGWRDRAGGTRVVQVVLTDPRGLPSNTLTLLSGVGLIGNPVTAWADDSTGGVHDFVNGVPAVSPTDVGGDIQCNGVDQYLLIAAGSFNTLLGATGWTAWVVAEQLSDSWPAGGSPASQDGYLTDPTTGIWGLHVEESGTVNYVYAMQAGTGNYKTPGIAIALNTPFLMEARWDGSDVYCKVGDTETSIAAPDRSPSGGYPSIGLSLSSRYTHAKWKAVVVCNEHLTPLVRAAVRAWLLDRFGL